MQASNPDFEKLCDDSDSTLSDAMETVFLMNTEDAYMIWRHISIPLSYKYDLSYMIDDILNLIEQLQKEMCGTKYISWLPDTFRSDWKVEWKNGKLIIYAEWYNITGGLEKILNKDNCLQMNIDDFLKEWKKILETIYYSLKQCNYTENQIYNMKRLFFQLNNIQEYGTLYTK